MGATPESGLNLWQGRAPPKKVLAQNRFQLQLPPAKVSGPSFSASRAECAVSKETRGLEGRAAGKGQTHIKATQEQPEGWHR